MKNPVQTLSNGEEEAGCQANNNSDPLHRRISQPHEQNDAIICSNKKKNKNPDDSQQQQQQQQHNIAGNQRLESLVQSRRPEYQQASPLERSMVALQILQEWRAQSPGGRFLKFNAETQLWNDIGDKKAREKISKMLREQTSSNNDDECDEMSHSDAANEKSGELSMVGRTVLDDDSQRDFKLYGRDDERQKLLDIFHRQTEASVDEDDQDQPVEEIELCLILGQAGTGKTALAHSLRNYIMTTLEAGLFLEASWVSGMVESTSIFTAVLTDFAQQLATSDEVEDYRNRLLHKLDDHEVGILTAMIPGMKSVFPSSSSEGAAAAQGTQANQRLVHIFRRFVQAIASTEAPLVVLLDDLHRASRESVDLTLSLLGDIDSRHILFVLTSQDESLVERLLSYLQPSKVHVNRIDLNNLDHDAVGDLLADNFAFDDHHKIEALSKLVYAITAGDILFVQELLRAFKDDGLLYFDKATKQWTCDIHLIEVTLESKSLGDLLKQNMMRLEHEALETVKVAAFLGSRIDEDLLTRIRSPAVSTHLQAAQAKGLLRLTHGFFHFANDAAHMAAYNLIPTSERESFHLRIGRKLWHALDEEGLDANAYVVLDQLAAAGKDGITKEKELQAVASLCLRGAEKAIATSAFQRSSIYLHYGIAVLGDRGWRDNYELNLRLHNVAIEVCYCVAHFDELDKLVNAILSNVRSFTDSLHARSSYIYSRGSRGHSVDAIDNALELLKELDEGIPWYPSTLQVMVAFRRTKNLLKKQSHESLLRLPPLQDHQKLYAMRILNLITLHALYARPTLLPLVVAHMIEITLEYGVCDMASVGFSYYGMLLSRYVSRVRFKSIDWLKTDANSHSLCLLKRREGDRRRFQVWHTFSESTEI